MFRISFCKCCKLTFRTILFANFVQENVFLQVFVLVQVSYSSSYFKLSFRKKVLQIVTSHLRYFFNYPFRQFFLQFLKCPGSVLAKIAKRCLTTILCKLLFLTIILQIAIPYICLHILQIDVVGRTNQSRTLKVLSNFTSCVNTGSFRAEQ